MEKMKSGKKRFVLIAVLGGILFAAINLCVWNYASANEEWMNSAYSLANREWSELNPDGSTQYELKLNSETLTDGHAIVDSDDFNFEHRTLGSQCYESIKKVILASLNIEGDYDRIQVQYDSDISGRVSYDRTYTIDYRMTVDIENGVRWFYGSFKFTETKSGHKTIDFKIPYDLKSYLSSSFTYKNYVNEYLKAKFNCKNLFEAIRNGKVEIKFTKVSLDKVDDACYRGYNEHYFDANGYVVDPSCHNAPGHNNIEIKNGDAFFTRYAQTAVNSKGETMEMVPNIPLNFGLGRCYNDQVGVDSYADIIGCYGPGGDVTYYELSHKLNNVYFDFSDKDGEYLFKNIAFKGKGSSFLIDYGLDTWNLDLNGEDFKVWFGIYVDGEYVDTFRVDFSDRCDGVDNLKYFSVPKELHKKIADYHIPNCWYEDGEIHNMWQLVKEGHLTIQVDAMICDTE